MTLFAHVPPGSGYSGLQQLGVESVPRRGRAGEVPDHAMLGKSASMRTIQDGFGIRNLSNVDLVLSRAPAPDDRVNIGAAGTLPRERRQRDLPMVIRQTSVEHQLHRRHSSSPMKTIDVSDNMFVRTSSCEKSASSIGRGVQGTRQSAGSRSASPALSPARSPRGAYRRSPHASQCSSVPLPLQMPDLWRTLRSPRDLAGVPCSWGADYAFDQEDSEPSGSPRWKGVTSGEDYAVHGAIAGAVEVLQRKATKESTWSSTCSDDYASTPLATDRSPAAMSQECGLPSSPSWLNDTHASVSTLASSASTAASGRFAHGKVTNKQFVQKYERHVHDLVKKAQQKSMRMAERS